MAVSVPEAYDRYMRPQLFEPWAIDRIKPCPDCETGAPTLSATGQRSATVGDAMSAAPG
jgi:hypothetical protein